MQNWHRLRELEEAERRAEERLVALEGRRTSLRVRMQAQDELQAASNELAVLLCGKVDSWL